MGIHKILDRGLRAVLVLAGIFIGGALLAEPAMAQQGFTTVNDLAKNTTESVSRLPGLLTAASYLLGILFGVLGVLKLKDHVENASQTPIRTPLIRLAAGGMLFALPIVYEAMRNSINPGPAQVFDPENYSFSDLMSSLLGSIGQAAGHVFTDINGVMGVIIGGIGEIPGIITAVAYLIALLAGVTGIIKIKEHVENPDQNPLREGIVRLLMGGALFALPSILIALEQTVTGGNGLGAITYIQGILGSLGFIRSGYDGLLSTSQFCIPGEPSVGGAICSMLVHSGALPAFLSALSYLIGLVLTVWGITKIRDHVLNPSQVKLTEGISKLAAAGLFITLPFLVATIQATITPAGSSAFALVPITGYNETSNFNPLSCDAAGLDGALYCFMKDIVAPTHIILNFFTFSVGTLLIMIGISRLLKSAQEGAKAPGGLGTLMTFFVGGALISYNEFMRVFSFSFFNLPVTKTNAQMQYTKGMSTEEQLHAHTVISAVLKFMIIVGLISFVRGLFIVRSVAEGGGNASMMAGLTHIIGGALAVNLGPLINAVQTTLGLTPYGILFS